MHIKWESNSSCKIEGDEDLIKEIPYDVTLEKLDEYLDKVSLLYYYHMRLNQSYLYLSITIYDSTEEVEGDNFFILSEILSSVINYNESMNQFIRSYQM